ncbi:four-carbon acid sugar kinase family protein [Quadrisphaera sp. INWT6]|uniref:four-carbon acid sugar kinase family protein n=1 Tax=Quadrisphaera sp. INWT6 TaxID=2596917 RepID=UPI0019D610A6|nr:four-carbon acid sugar kinase family protein [Quadrisphaera sp. INWT6]
MTLGDLLDGLPAPHPVEAAAVAERVAASGRVLVVLDDDPTGTQSVHGVPVLTSWAEDDLAWGLQQGAPCVYVLTNTRALGPDDAARTNREVVTAGVAAARRLGVDVGFVSRGDSTLRGHFPLETDTITATLRELGEPVPDAVLLVPAFPDAGRITVGAVHHWCTGGTCTPVGETEFARDATFGFTSSDLRDWVAEKSAPSGGPAPVAREDVLALTLADLRRGPEAAAAVLRGARDGRVVVVDAADERDLRVLALAEELLAGEGQRFLHRVGPPFVRARVGMEERAPLTREEVPTGDARGGLVVVGSHVGLTTRQLEQLRGGHRLADQVEVEVAAVLDADRREQHLAAVVDRLVAALAAGDVVVSTSRVLTTGGDAAASLDIAVAVSRAVVEVVQGVVARTAPRFVVAKGGITSSDVARYGLGIRRAVVRGPLLPGLVSLWEPVEGPAAGVPYVVFAGNVGDDASLLAVVRTLSATP